MPANQAPYLVYIVEYNPISPAVVLRKMLIAKFVAKGDAIAYAVHRRDTSDKPFYWHVELPDGSHVFETRPLSRAT